MGLRPPAAKNLPDDELVVLAVQGDNVAKEELIRRYDPLIRRMVQKICFDPAHREDVAQEARIHWCGKWSNYKPCSKFRQWTSAVIRNKARRSSEELTQPWDEEPLKDYDPETEEWREIELPDDGPGPEDEIARRGFQGMLRRVIERCLGKLSDKQREALVAHDIRQMSYEAMAAEFSEKQGTLRKRVHDARKAMRKCLEKRAARKAMRKCLEERARQGDESAVVLLDWIRGLPDDATKGDSKRRPRRRDTEADRDTEGGARDAD